LKGLALSLSLSPLCNSFSLKRLIPHHTPLSYSLSSFFTQCLSNPKLFLSLFLFLYPHYYQTSPYFLSPFLIIFLALFLFFSFSFLYFGVWVFDFVVEVEEGSDQFDFFFFFFLLFC
jgi:hypothetical protein